MSVYNQSQTVPNNVVSNDDEYEQLTLQFDED